ncbi:Fusaric acid resistance protein-like-domain-containing protein [Radiomyces spectabilis]|uniref:Fusaric acid resistance protein-like-domain-containing protein n=1 Tax=Radiomyces spectabilis TaxID=64574 RepID=UPI00221EEF2D|nr:Fusaric acid resistance protein-like-domain-containing protein [Radiomyces spectabilis]KAI8367685.1 Fusaric acid resistance protein-like-domain-containing protein [Radiomyces spectabilis]
MDIQPPSKRFPRNATPTYSHSSENTRAHFSTSPQSFDNSMLRFQSDLDQLTRSPSAYSEIEVILDDGSVQKRTVSLSTIPDSPVAEENERPTLRDMDDSTATTGLLSNTSNGTYGSIDTRSDSSTEPSNASEGSDDCATNENCRHSRIKLPKPSRSTFRKQWHRLCNKIRSRTHLSYASRMVLKCSFAYFLASLFTFIPWLNASIGHNRTSSHLVATATVFFNPAKTLGGMVEAATYGLSYLMFAVCICLGSMITTDFFIDRDYYNTAHVISLFFWLAGATYIVSFLKAHWNKPPVATASSLCFIIIFIIVVREGSANRGDFDATRIQQITSAVATGTLITLACCVVFWPVSACKKLGKDLETSLQSYRVLLKLLVKTFILDDDLPEFQANKTLQAAIESHQASFTALQKSLQEAKLESWNESVRYHAKDYDRIVESMQRLAQYIGGLRSSCGLQFEHMTSRHTQGQTSPKLNRSFTSADTWNVRAGFRRRKLQDNLRRQRTAVGPVIPRSVTAEDALSSTAPSPRKQTLDDDSLPTFIATIRKPLKSLAYTCKQTIIRMQTIFSSTASAESMSSDAFELSKTNLKKAIDLFEKAEKAAVIKLRKRQVRQETGDDNNLQLTLGEDIFLVYFFIFNVIEFAKELITLVEAVERLCAPAENQHSWLSWLCWQGPKDQLSDMRRERQTTFDHFKPNERHATDTLHTPTPKTKLRAALIRAWKTFSLFKTQKVRYATKACIAAIILATPAFLESTGPAFREWRMEWALITLMVVMTPTVGGTNVVAIYRVFSTILGCCMAAIFYALFPANIFVLPVLTWLFSIPNFWVILNHKHGKFGQFTLLAYNLVMLNKYNDRDINTISVWLLAWQRCMAILVGVFVGLVATAYVWPYEARVELRKGLSDFLLRLAWLYQKLVSIHLGRRSNPNTIFTEFFEDNARVQHLTLDRQRELVTETFMDLELSLQRSLSELRALLAQTPNEPRLKGPFPVGAYRAMLDSCQNIIDKFLSMRITVLKDIWATEIRGNLVMPVNQQRREMVGNVLLYFYLLASALRLKTPLPPYFPPARKAWQSLLVRMRELPALQSEQSLEKDNVYIVYYAYVTMMEDIIRELDKVKSLFVR